MLQGMHLVEGSAALRELAKRWKHKSCWAFTVLHSRFEPPAKDLELPALPGVSGSPQRQFPVKKSAI